ncbi:hypothetical protein HPB47_021653 [Ixodes persulcatus]|uniref:Uncharacterized protein n=1 Tax=Ixodes persulcatus TaxID=34615 RepID=A0AC60QC51_IXOPE|nr:hypothetical protein HPB47_021653 [Ixodes persulcatus]
MAPPIRAAERWRSADETRCALFGICSKFLDVPTRFKVCALLIRSRVFESANSVYTRLPRFGIEMIVFPMAPIFTPMDRGAFPDCGSMMSRMFDGNDFDRTFFDGIVPAGLFGYPEDRRSSYKKCPASEVSLTPDNFALKLDVRGFVPEEISVKTVGNSVEVHARHEEKDPEGRSFYTLPDDVDPESVTSQLRGRGLLAVEAPRKKAETTPLSHTVPISVEHTSSNDVPSTSQESS